MKPARRHRIATALLVLLAGVALGACRAEAPAAVLAPEADGLPRNMTPAQVSDLLAEDAIVLVDVREPDEWAAGHVDGAILVPLDDLAARLDELPTDKPVVTMCRSGRRSRIAFKTLSDGGYEELHHLEGGILAWKRDGLPVTSP